MTDASWQLPPTSRSVPEARRFVAATLKEWQLSALADTATLLVSEVVTNAVLHARTDLTVALRREGNGIRVEVTDGSPLPPALRRHSNIATTGRGLRLLDMLADEWSANQEQAGKTVWFTLSGSRDPWAAAARIAEGEV